MKDMQKWYVTFKTGDRFATRYHIISATSLDQARKKTIDFFGRDWENIYSVKEWKSRSIPKRLTKNDYIELTMKELKRHFERKGRIRYKIYVDKD